MIIKHHCPVCGEYVYETDPDAGYSINGSRNFRTKFMFHHGCMKGPEKLVTEHKTGNNTILSIEH